MRPCGLPRTNAGSLFLAGGSFFRPGRGPQQTPGVYQRLINLMPPHRVYIEPFLGSGAIMRMKKPAAVSVGIDKDAGAIRRFVEMSNLPPGSFGVDDAIDFLARYRFRGDELVYCDPPYLHSTRQFDSLEQYGHEMTDSDHVRLLKVLRKIGGRTMVMLSGYRSEMYLSALAGWSSLKFETRTRQGNRREEWVWFNFPQPTRLHDYSFLGADFRERERIKRKKLRWTARLGRLDLMERQALLSVIEADWFGSTHAKTDDSAGTVTFGLGHTIEVAK